MFLIFEVLAPKLAEFLTKHDLVHFFPMKPIRFLEGVTNEIVARRKAKIDVRDDFIQSMIDHESNNPEEKESTKEQTNNQGWNGPLKKSLTTKEMLAQAIMFMAAGYETTATTLEFVTYNLARHQEVQDKLIKEIDDVLDKHVSFRKLINSILIMIKTFKKII